ncbi:MAG: stage II sporulation protein P [Clostridia bacterium]|nr:stage II sporulation protein P [Clostridia bacterium]
MRHNQTALSAALSVVLCALLLGTILLLPQTVSEDLLYLTACAVLPEGNAPRLRALRAKPSAAKEAVRAAAQETSRRALTETPADVLEWMRRAQAAAATQKKDGDIRSETLGKRSATETFRGLLIRNVTDDTEPDYEALWDADAELTIDKSRPAVLIFHTHTTEGFELLDRDWYAADTSSRTRDVTRNVARVGSAIAEELEAAGFQVIHDTTVHDTSYSGAYDRSRETVEGYLKKYPELSVVLDVHRDAIQENNGTKVKPIAEIGGKKAAQVMIISGAEGGNVTDFPNWEKNLRFALRLQDACDRTAAGLMRPIFFCHRQYNMDLTPCSLLVEFGSEANTLEEAVYAGRLFGVALAELLENYVI